jgi:CRP/FNR family transcriptional regulator, polysaccharide utilization system transcription regulator
MEFNVEKYQLKSLSFYEMLLPEEAKYARRRSERLEFKKGQTIIREGTFSKGIYIVRKGKVKIHNSNSEGKESILYIYRRDEFFGYRPLVANEPNPVSATALENVVVTFIPKETFVELLDSSPVFARRILASITSEFSVWINKITLFSQHAVKERIAMALLILSRVYQRGPGSRSKVVIDMKREDLAAYIGTAMETVVRMLRVFKDGGIISSRGTKITINRPEVLLDYLGYF